MPKMKENYTLKDENYYLNEENDTLNEEIRRLNSELSTYERQLNSSNYSELKKQLSEDAAYSMDLLHRAEFNDQERLLYLYRTFVQLLYELETKDDVDLNRLIKNMEQAEEALKYFG